MTYETITFEVQDKVGLITLNRPSNLNAINDLMKAELLAVIKHANDNRDTIGCLLLTGAGVGFCSGADLSPEATQGKMIDIEQNLNETYNPVMVAMAQSQIPMVAAVNGIAAGAGMSFAIAADIVFAATSAQFLQAFVNIGLVPDAGSSYMLPRLVGRARANAIMMLGEKLDAETAENWGLIYKTVADEALLDTALATAKKLANGPTVSLGGIRKLAAMSEHNSLAEQLSLEASIQGSCSRTHDFMEGVTAFLQKRKPTFKGK